MWLDTYSELLLVIKSHTLSNNNEDDKNNIYNVMGVFTFLSIHVIFYTIYPFYFSSCTFRAR